MKNTHLLDPLVLNSKEYSSLLHWTGSSIQWVKTQLWHSLSLVGIAEIRKKKLKRQNTFFSFLELSIQNQK